MNCEETGISCCYRIDGDDRVVWVSDAWISFAQENGAAESCHPDAVLNRSIWDFIDGIETRYLYDILLKKLRQTRSSAWLTFRCDAPDKRRYLALHISAAEKDTVEFESTVIREEVRDSVLLLEPDIPRSEKFIKLCSMCKKVEVANNSWLEIEAAIAILGLFEESALPKISHGLCQECFASVMAEVARL